MKSKLIAILLVYMSIFFTSVTFAENECLKLFESQNEIENNETTLRTLSHRQRQIFADPHAFWKVLNDRLLERSKNYPEDPWNFSVADIFMPEAEKMIQNLETAVNRFKFFRLSHSLKYAQTILEDFKTMVNPNLPSEDRLPYWKFIEAGRRQVRVMTMATDSLSMFLRVALEAKAKAILIGRQNQTDVVFTRVLEEEDSTSLHTSIDFLKNNSSPGNHVFWVPSMEHVPRRLFNRIRSSGLRIIDFSGRRQSPHGGNDDRPDYFTWHDEFHTHSSHGVYDFIKRSHADIRKEVHFDVWIDNQIQLEKNQYVRVAAEFIFFYLGHEVFVSVSDYRRELFSSDLTFMNSSTERSNIITSHDRRTWWTKETFEIAFKLIYFLIDTYKQKYGLPKSLEETSK